MKGLNKKQQKRQNEGIEIMKTKMNKKKERKRTINRKKENKEEKQEDKKNK